MKRETMNLVYQRRYGEARQGDDGKMRQPSEYIKCGVAFPSRFNENGYDLVFYVFPCATDGAVRVSMMSQRDERRDGQQQNRQRAQPRQTQDDVDPDPFNGDDIPF